MRRLASTLAWIALVLAPWLLVSWHADGAVSSAKKKTTAKKKSRIPKAPPVSAKARAQANDDVSAMLGRTVDTEMENPAAMVPFFEQLRRLKSGHPQLEINLKAGLTATTLEMLKTNALDVGLCALPIEDPVFETTSLFEDPLVAILPAKMTKVPKKVTPAFLSRCPLILINEGSALRRTVGEWLQQAGPPPKPLMEFDHVEAIKQILDAARATYVDRFVHSLPEGYDALINEEGDNISAGQKQLLTIARAFLADPAILILDEATSSVDTRTEVLIQEAMNALRRERTSFVIAHRLSTIRGADIILVMENGSIVEQGSHNELLGHDGPYSRLYNSQFVSPVVDVA